MSQLVQILEAATVRRGSLPVSSFNEIPKSRVKVCLKLKTPSRVSARKKNCPKTNERGAYRCRNSRPQTVLRAICTYTSRGLETVATGAKIVNFKMHHEDY